MNTSNLRKTTFLMSAASILPHLFCCALPAAAAIIALGGTIGLGAVLASNPLYNFVDKYHTYLIIVAIIGVVISGVLNFIAYRIDCRDAACTHSSCKPKKTKAFRIFIFSCFLLLVDLGWFTLEEYILGNPHGHGQTPAEQVQRETSPAGGEPAREKHTGPDGHKQQH